LRSELAQQVLRSKSYEEHARKANRRAKQGKDDSSVRWWFSKGRHLTIAEKLEIRIGGLLAVRTGASYQGIALAMPQVIRNQSPLQGLGVGSPPVVLNKPE